jgi:hypothetical protein
VLLRLLMVGVAAGCATVPAEPSPVRVEVLSNKTFLSKVAGGTGGTPFSLLCPDGWVMTGLKAGSGLYVDRVVAVCSPLRVTSGAAADAPSSGADHEACGAGDPEACLRAGNGATADAKRAEYFRRAAALFKERSGAGQKSARPSSVRLPPPEQVDYSRMAERVSEWHYRLKRGPIRAELSDLSRLGLQARVIPAYGGGVYRGFKLVGVRAASLYRAIGLRSGDIIQAVGGAPVQTPREAIRFYDALRAGEDFEVTVERGGKANALRLEFVD